MKKWLKTLIILVVAAVVVIGGIMGYGAYKSSKALKEKYDVYPQLTAAGVNDMGLYISASGNIISSEELKINTTAYGEIAAQNVQAGQKVKAGDVLAEIDGETLLDDIETLESDIFYKELEIEKSVFTDDVYYIKSPIAGEVKDIKVKEDDEDTENTDEASDIDEVMAEYGYLALISSDDLMYVVTEESADFLKAGAEVKVSRYSYEYDGVVEKTEGGKTYILINDDNLSVGGRVNIYAEGSKEKITGTTELYDWVAIDVPTQEGRISKIYVYNNEQVEQGEKLFRVTARSQDMVDMYNELDDLKEQLAEKKEMLESLKITAPVDGIITEISIEKGTDVESDTLAYTLADTSVWVVKLEVDELDISQIQMGMKANVTVDAYDEATFEGTVSAISSVGTASNGVTSYEVLVEVKNNDVFKLNMTASAEIEVDFIPSALTVPVEAVREINGRSFVVVYKNPTEDEVEAAKKQMMEAEKNIESTVSSFSEMSDEDIAALREKAQEARESGQMPEGGFGGRGSGQALNTAGDQNMAGGFETIAIVSQLSIADRLYGEPVQVEVGLINETYAQIVSGLDEGAQIIISDSDSSTASSSFFGGGNPLGGGGFGGAFR